MKCCAERNGAQTPRQPCSELFSSVVSVKPGENSKNLKLLEAKIQSNFSPIWPKSSDVVDLIKIFGACFFEHVKLEEQGFQSATILLGWVVGLSSLS